MCQTKIMWTLFDIHMANEKNCRNFVRYFSPILFMRSVVLLSMFVTASFVSVADNAVEVTDSTSAAVDSVRTERAGLIRRAYDWVYNYIDGTNESRPDKRFDVSFVGGPKYSSSRSFGLAAVAQGLYSMAPGDTLTPMSSVAVTVSASLTGYHEVEIEGVNIFRGDRYRLGYYLSYLSERSEFWGIGYDMASCDDNESKYSMRKSDMRLDFSIEVLPNFYVTPMIENTYVGGRRFVKPELWEGMPKHTNSFAPGIRFMYDSRDNINSTYSGLYLSLSQRFFGRVFNGDNNFSSTEFRVKYFTGLWRGCILATQLHGHFTYGHTPWGMLPQFGGSRVMRGYYEGRYRDKDLLDVVVELRQHVWKRSGVVAWVGAATVVPELGAMRWRKVLPNFGVGYRFEFKHRINARADIGFGRHGKSIELSLNEAF